MKYYCDICDRERILIKKETEGGIIRICEECYDSNNPCPTSCKNKDIKCIECVDLKHLKR